MMKQPAGGEIKIFKSIFFVSKLRFKGGEERQAYREEVSTIQTKGYLIATVSERK